MTAALLSALFAAQSQGLATTPPDLAGSSWRPVQIGSLAIPEDARASLSFNEDGKLAGRGGCNRFFGRFRTSGTDIELGPIGSTKMACHGPAGETEKALFSAFKNTASFEIDDASLRLFDASGIELARFVKTG